MDTVIATARENLRRTGTARDNGTTVSLQRDTPDAEYRVQVVRNGERTLLDIPYAKEGNAINAALAELFGSHWDAWWAKNKPNPTVDETETPAAPAPVAAPAAAQTIRLTDAQQSALEVSGLNEADDPANEFPAIRAAWDDGKRTLTITAANLEAITSELIDLSNRQDAQAEEQDDPFARRAARTLSMLTDKVNRPAAPPVSAKIAAIRAKRAEAIQRLKDRPQAPHMVAGVPDTELVGIVLEVVNSYLEEGIVRFQEAARQFHEEFGDHAEAERYFEIVWEGSAGQPEDGTPIGAAMGAAAKMTNRPTVKAAVAAYTAESEGARGGGEAGPEPAGVRSGGAAEPGGGGVQSVRAGGEGSLGAVSPETVGGTEGAGAVEAGGDHPPAGAPAALPGGPDTGANRPAPGPNQGAVPPRGVPTAGGTAGPVGIQGDKPADYQLTPERIAGIINRTDIPRLTDNIAALRLLEDLETEHRYATPDEQDVLAKLRRLGRDETRRHAGGDGRSHLVEERTRALARTPVADHAGPA